MVTITLYNSRPSESLRVKVSPIHFSPGTKKENKGRDQHISRHLCLKTAGGGGGGVVTPPATALLCSSPPCLQG